MRYNGFCGGTYVAESINADNEQTINFYPEKIESPNGKAAQVLYPTPGFAPFATVEETGGRALATMNGQTFAVMAGTVYLLEGRQKATPLGFVTQDANLAQFAFNGLVGNLANAALIASGTNGYVLDLGSFTVRQVLIGTAYQVGMLDNLGIAFDKVTGRIYTSDQADFTAWDPTQWIARQDAPDIWTAICVNPPDIWAVGPFSGTVLYDAGTFPFRLAPRPGLNFKYGIAAPFSIAASGPSVLWLSQSQEGAGIVVRTSGYNPQRVSNYALEATFAMYARDFGIADAEGLIYQDHGHTFYCLRFPRANATWVYDLELDTWHRRGYWNDSRNQYDLWRARVHTYAFGQHITASELSQTIATMDVENPTELNGEAIRRLRRAPGIFTEHRDVPIRRIEVYLESGTSLQSGACSNAQIMWRTSDDGGYTWGNERQVPIGKVGQYQTVVRMHRMGIARDRVNEMTVSDPIVSWRIVDAYVNNDDQR